jgi:hypothetical protein
MMLLKLLRERLQEWVGLLYYVLLGHHLIMDLICDISASISVIPYTLYLEIKADIDPIKMEETGMTIQLANKE